MLAETHIKVNIHYIKNLENWTQSHHDYNKLWYRAKGISLIFENTDTSLHRNRLAKFEKDTTKCLKI